MKALLSLAFVICMIFGLLFFNGKPKITIKVTATAFNSVPNQTEGDPNITAFGDTLIPGEKCIAVSRDLLKLGLTHNSEVQIEGMSGTYLVKDKMHKRWEKRIDIYMGNDVVQAREWGKRQVTITFKDN